MRMSRLLRYLLIHCAGGVAAGWLMLAGLIWCDAAGLGTLIAHADGAFVPLFILAASFAVTFGSAAMGSAIMLLGEDGDGRHQRDEGACVAPEDASPALLRAKV